MSEDQKDGRHPAESTSRINRLGAAELGEDATGFGRVELRTVRDTLLRPRSVLEAYMTAGPTGGGVYTRPLRLYLGLGGFLMLLLFLKGGAGLYIEQLGPDQLEALITRSGKSREAFLADADGWMSLTLVPVLSAFYALMAMPVLRLWDSERLGWRRGFRASVVFLNAWTIPMLPLAWFSYEPALVGFTLPLVIGLAVAAFWRTGRGRWWRNPWIGVVKGVAIALLMQVAGNIGMIPVMAIGLLGGLWGP